MSELLDFQSRENFNFFQILVLCNGGRKTGFFNRLPKDLGVRPRNGQGHVLIGAPSERIKTIVVLAGSIRSECEYLFFV